MRKVAKKDCKLSLFSQLSAPIKSGVTSRILLYKKNQHNVWSLGLLLWNVFENRKRTFFLGRKTKRTEFDRQSYHGRKFPDKLIGKRAPRELQLQQHHHVRRPYSSRAAFHKKYSVPKTNVFFGPQNRTHRVRSTILSWPEISGQAHR